jgi:SEC-C motif
MDKLSVDDPCPCGSGLKYKKCHGHAVAEKRPSIALLRQIAMITRPGFTGCSTNSWARAI